MMTVDASPVVKRDEKMSKSNSLGRPVRLGLISAGVPSAHEEYLRRACSLGENVKSAPDDVASSALAPVIDRTRNLIAFNVCVGGEMLTGPHYSAAVRWLLDAGVDAIVCTKALKDEEMQIVGAHQRAKLMGIPVIVADSSAHRESSKWSQDIIMALADNALASDEAVWEINPEVCRIGGVGHSNASAAGILAGVAMAELERSLPRTELLDSLREWTLASEPRLAS